MSSIAYSSDNNETMGQSKESLAWSTLNQNIDTWTKWQPYTDKIFKFSSVKKKKCDRSLFLMDK